MKSIEVKAQKREILGKKRAKELREKGMVPGVLYGKNGVVHLVVPFSELRDLVYTPNVYLIDLNIDGTIEKAMIQDLQWHPVEEMLMHVDFLRVIDNKPLTINIPVKVTGMAKGVKAGGRLKVNMRLLRIKALPENLPDNIEIDITQLAIGDSIKVNEVKKDNLEFLDNKSNLIVGVVTTRISQSDIDLLEEEEEEQEESGEDTAEDQLQS